MTTLVWDTVGERVFQTGVDRGVLYLRDDVAVSWSGLIGVEESPESELKSFYLDGVKYLQNLTPGEFLGKLKAYTYPKEFDTVIGIDTPAPGISFHEQPPESFNLTYRTRVGNDLQGVDFGYKIHLLYNLFAKPDSYGFDTIDSSVNPIEFSWDLSGTPVKFDKMKPMVHITIDSTTAPPDSLSTLEDMLYGTDDSTPTFPTIIEVALIFGFMGPLTIVDNGDGSWTATDLGTEFVTTYISMLDSTTFEIDHADVTYLDADTYEISSTDLGWTS